MLSFSVKGDPLRTFDAVVAAAHTNADIASDDTHSFMLIERLSLFKNECRVIRVLSLG